MNYCMWNVPFGIYKIFFYPKWYLNYYAVIQKDTSINLVVEYDLIRYHLGNDSIVQILFRKSPFWVWISDFNTFLENTIWLRTIL
jgi:hypothetical protein